MALAIPVAPLAAIAAAAAAPFVADAVGAAASVAADAVGATVAAGRAVAGAVGKFFGTKPKPVDLKDENAELKKKNTKLEDDNSEQKKKIIMLKIKIILLEIKIRKLKKECEIKIRKLEKELEDTRKAALVFMDAADIYQEASEKHIKAKVEELEDTRKAALVFMDAADTYQEAAEKQIKAKVEELEVTRKAALVFMDAADTYQEAAEKQIKVKVDELEVTRKAALVFMDAADTYQEAAEKQIKAKVEELEVTKANLDLVVGKYDKLQLQVLTAQQKHSLFESEIKRLKIQVSVLLEAKEVATKACDAEKAKMMKELEDFTEEARHDMDAQADKLRVELAELHVSLSQLQTSYDELDAKHSCLNDEKNSIQEALVAEKAEACKIMSEFEALVKYGVEKDDEIEKIMVNLEEKKKEIDILNRDIELLHLQMAKTQRKKKASICAAALSSVKAYLSSCISK